ncbi:hypothetical protein GKE82_23895 [Conexibacter sp. W3-3-2]|uniref:site-specific integrase n=1 Tax=Conexibacter sp. W3-3-2 TaxID=2675227 RepID=UPI0012B95629|nr:site-specific integrase [Conexibacter sp. W3-3-2]MTD47250.1 hypothetical protein [Conexibacter sp. W3-3-2]
MDAVLPARGRPGVIATRNLALLGVLVGAGLRVSEALNLQVRNVLDGGRALRVRHARGPPIAWWGSSPRYAALLATWLAMRTGLGLNGRQPIFCTVADGSGA